MIRIKYIDDIKGFAILVVVFAHVYVFTLCHSEALAWKICASFEMYLFMFISGYVAYIPKGSLNNGQLKKKTKSRILSYLVPCYVVSWLVLAIRLLFQEDLNFFSAFVEGYWYLKSLAIYCAMGYLLYKCKSIWLELAICLCAFVLFVIGWKSGTVLNEVFSCEHLVCFFPFYMLGQYSRRFDLIEQMPKKGLIFAFALFIYVVLMSIDFPSHLINNISGRFIIPVAAIVVIVLGFRYIQLKPVTEKCHFNWLNIIGVSTLDIYLFHMVLMQRLNLRLEYNVFYSYPHGELLEFAFAVVITIVVSYITMLIGRLLRKSKFCMKFIYGKL